MQGAAERASVKKIGCGYINAQSCNSTEQSPKHCRQASASLAGGIYEKGNSPFAGPGSLISLRCHPDAG